MHSSSPEAVQEATSIAEQDEGPRISFSSEFFEESNFISIRPTEEDAKDTEKERNANFEFLSSKSANQSMSTADELFFDGKLLPCWQIRLSEKLNNVSVNTKEPSEVKAAIKDHKEGPPGNWFVDEDPSPRPPTCTVLWKELLRLKKQRASSLSPSPSSSSSSSSSSSLADVASQQGRSGKPEKRAKRGIERTKSVSMRMRPIVFVPVSGQSKIRTIPTLFR